MLNEVLPKWLRWHDDVVEEQVTLCGGFGAADAARCKWFKTDRVRILPLLVCNYNVRDPPGLPEPSITLNPPVGLHIHVADSRWVYALTDLMNGGDIQPEVAALFVRNRGSMVVPFLKDVGTLCTYR